MIESGKGKELLLEVAALLSPCTLCERKCRVDRLNGERGYCNLGVDSYVFKDFIRIGEEADLSPSHAIYFTGCNMRCLSCSNEEYLKDPCMESPLDCKKLAKRIDYYSDRSKNVNFIGGEPTVNLYSIVKILSYMKCSLPVAWNSNMYASESAMKIIDSFSDIYLADFKYGNNKCSQSIADTDRYLETVTRNILSIKSEKQIIIRHLPLPGHAECCSKPIIDWISDHLPSAELSIILGMIPTREFSESVSEADLEILMAYSEEKGVKMVKPSAVPKEESDQMDSEGKITTNIIIKPDGSIIFQDLDPEMANVAKRI